MQRLIICLLKNKKKTYCHEKTNRTIYTRIFFSFLPPEPEFFFKPKGTETPVTDDSPIHANYQILKKKTMGEKTFAATSPFSMYQM